MWGRLWKHRGSMMVGGRVLRWDLTCAVPGDPCSGAPPQSASCQGAAFRVFLARPSAGRPSTPRIVPPKVPDPRAPPFHPLTHSSYAVPGPLSLSGPPTSSPDLQGGAGQVPGSPAGRRGGERHAPAPGLAAPAAAAARARPGALGAGREPGPPAPIGRRRGEACPEKGGEGTIYPLTGQMFTALLVLFYLAAGSQPGTRQGCRYHGATS